MTGVGAGEEHKSSRTFQIGGGDDIQGENELCFLHTADIAHSPGQPGERQGLLLL